MTAATESLALAASPPSGASGPPSGELRRGERAAQPVTILLAEPDPFLREILEASLRLRYPRFRILPTSGPAPALAATDRHRVDVVVSELEFPGELSGVDLLAALAASHPGTPVVLLTASPAADVRETLTVDAVLAKPPDVDQLFREIDRAVDLRRDSVLRGLALESVLQVLEVERKTCTLTVLAGAGTGRFYLEAGRLVHAEAGDGAVTGREAVFAVLSWDDCTIHLTEGCDVAPTIHERPTELLMEHAVRRDHERRL